MSWHRDFQAEVMATVEATWPDCVGRIFKSAQTARTDLLQAITKGQAGGGTSLPMVIVQIGKATRDDAHGLHNRAFRCPVVIHRLSRMVDEYTLEALDAIDALAIAIERRPHTSFRAIEAGEPDGEEANAFLAVLTDARMNAYVATLAYVPGLLSGDFDL